MTVFERALKYADACPPAISGQEGSTPTFALACCLVHGFCLSEPDVWAVMNHYNQTKCQPPWSESQLAHKIEDAFNKKSLKPVGWLLDSPGKVQRPNGPFIPPKKLLPDPVVSIEKFLHGFRCSETDLSEASPVRMGEDWRKDAALLVAHLFEPQEQVNYVMDWQPHVTKSGDQKANPDGVGKSVVQSTFVSWFSKNLLPKSQAGGWMRINPVDGRGVGDGNITAFRHALIEFDKIPLDLQLSFLSLIPLPISAILTSGGKSVHAWVKVGCQSFEEYEHDVLKMRAMLIPYGIDRVNKNPSRLSRMVGVERIIGAVGDGRQRLIYLNPNPEQKGIL